LQFDHLSIFSKNLTKICSITIFLFDETPSRIEIGHTKLDPVGSTVPCALRDDEAVYWVRKGKYEAVGN